MGLHSDAYERVLNYKLHLTLERRNLRKVKVESLKDLDTEVLEKKEKELDSVLKELREWKELQKKLKDKE